MSHVLTRLADGLVARFVPALRAQAAICAVVDRFCYCAGGLRYTRQCLVCTGQVVSCKECRKTISFCSTPR